MAKNNTLVLCLFLVLLIFVAGSNAASQDIGLMKQCTDSWEEPCVTEEDCKKRCHRDHGKSARPNCLVQAHGTRDLCECYYNC
ncbi:hypothetical protein MKW94_005555 [Papaver nudicaule]|uniref:Uncharacterized protein n=1 Tax=Papaver nudicaule TaxID=74823 RepID=A0AA41RZC0_PAPNU|nr:hypothetical protein [Papaver nudicaule]